MNKKALEENENNIIGSGMFKLKEWVAGDRIVLERNEYFKEANSNVKEIIIKFIPEANSRMIMLEIYKNRTISKYWDSSIFYKEK